MGATSAPSHASLPAPFSAACAPRPLHQTASRVAAEQKQPQAAGHPPMMPCPKPKMAVSAKKAATCNTWVGGVECGGWVGGTGGLAGWIEVQSAEDVHPPSRLRRPSCRACACLQRQPTSGLDSRRFRAAPKPRGACACPSPSCTAAGPSSRCGAAPSRAPASGPTTSGAAGCGAPAAAAAAAAAAALRWARRRRRCCRLSSAARRSSFLDSMEMINVPVGSARRSREDCW